MSFICKVYGKRWKETVLRPHTHKKQRCPSWKFYLEVERRLSRKLYVRVYVDIQDFVMVIRRLRRVTTWHSARVKARTVKCLFAPHSAGGWLRDAGAQPPGPPARPRETRPLSLGLGTFSRNHCRPSRRFDFADGRVLRVRFVRLGILGMEFFFNDFGNTRSRQFCKTELRVYKSEDFYEFLECSNVRFGVVPCYL